MQLVGKCSATVGSVCWATVDWSWLKEWNKHAWAVLHLKENTGRDCFIKPSFPRILVCKEKATTTTKVWAKERLVKQNQTVEWNVSCVKERGMEAAVCHCTSHDNCPRIHWGVTVYHLLRLNVLWNVCVQCVCDFEIRLYQKHWIHLSDVWLAHCCLYSTVAIFMSSGYLP